jgi:two-component system, OmpR family, KDP operon response regulator KdpE
MVLASAGYTVVTAWNGEETLEEIAKQNGFDVALLDLELPDFAGFDLSARIRKISDIPIVTMSVLGAEENKVQAFNAGADDYLVKPFGVPELLARIRSLRRRRGGIAPLRQFKSDQLLIDFELQRVFIDSHVVWLTPKEFGLLGLLVQHEGRPVSHHALVKSLWGPEHAHKVELLRDAICQLRKKLEASDLTRYIHTEHGLGYRFEPIAIGHGCPFGRRQIRNTRDAAVCANGPELAACSRPGQVRKPAICMDVRRGCDWRHMPPVAR